MAQIITFGKMQARAVIRDVGRALDMPYGEVDRIAKMIPNTLNITLKEALQQEPRLKELAKSNPEVKKLLTLAQSLEGLPRHASTHAAGVVISNRPLVEVVPLYRGQQNEVVTQYAMKDVEKIGLIKFDFLGLKTLTMIEDVLRRVESSRGEKLDIRKIPSDRPENLRASLLGGYLGRVPAGKLGDEGSRHPACSRSASRISWPSWPSTVRGR